MSTDDDWALGQNEVDVRNEARKNAMLGLTEPDSREVGSLPMEAHSSGASPSGSVSPFFACRNPEQAWINESRAEAEREDKS